MTSKVNKMKILYIHNTNKILNSNSIFRANLIQVISMCNAFSNLGNIVTLILPISRNDNINSLIHKLQYHTGKINFSILPFHKFGIKKIHNRYLNAITTIDILYKINADIVILRDPLLIPIVNRMKIKFIYESHNLKLHNSSRILDKILSYITIKYSKSIYFVKLITISQSLKRAWQVKGFPENKLFFYHDGFELTKFQDKIPSAQARKSLNLNLNKKLIVYTGSLYEDREIDNIIYLAQQFSNANFMVIGGPNESKVYFQKLASQLGLNNIIFMGYVPHKDVPLYLFASDILLALWSDKVPTIKYCSPLKVFEYMATGRTIISHGYDVIKEVLKDNENCLLVKPNSQNDLRLKVQLALENSYDHLGENARNNAFEHYSWDKRAQTILNQL